MTPPSDYAWNVQGKNDPPSAAQYVRLTVRASWTANGVSRNFSLQSLLGERKSTTLQVDGFARIDHLLQVLTSFDIGGSRSDLTVTAGTAQAQIESRAVTSADLSITAGLARLVDTNSPRAFTDPAPAIGASVSRSSPPTADGVGSNVSAGARTLTHPQLAGTQIAGFAGTLASGPETRQVNSLPIARGAFDFVLPTSPLDLLMVNNQADTSATSPLRLAPTGKVVWMTDASGRTMYGNVAAETTPTGPGRKVQTTAVIRGSSSPVTAGAATINVLPVTFISGNGPVIEISNFRATVDCPSTAISSTTPVANWNANLRYWRETGQPLGNNTLDGAYATVETAPGAGLSGSRNTGAPRVDPLAALVASPPLVYESLELDDPERGEVSGSARDVYLFPVQHTHEREVDDEDITVNHQHRGYLSAWSSLRDPVTAKDALGRSTSAQIEGAIKLTTTPTDPTNGASTVSVSVGSLACQALDRRL